MGLDSILEIAASLVIIGAAREFFKAFMAKAGESAFSELQGFLSDLQNKTSPSQKRWRETVLIRDRETQVGILLTADLPENALKLVLRMNLNETPGSPKTALAWDTPTQSWRPQPYPAKRTDVFGWYGGPPMDPYLYPLWHLTQQPETSPIVTLCKQSLTDPPFRVTLGDGGQCQRCMVVDGILISGHVPEWWDEERAEYKHRLAP
jgi:hypothetical protein